MALAPTNRTLVDQALAYDLAETQRLRRAQWAQEAGLPPGEFARPFPGNQVTITHNHGEPMGKKLLPLLLSAALGVAGAAGVGGLLLRGPAAPPAATAPAVKPVDLRVKWWVENGQVKAQVEQP
jgi:hypothetical protein